MKKVMELIKKQDEYIELIREELGEIALIAHLHGWRSTRYDVGVKFRAEIEALKKEIANW